MNSRCESGSVSEEAGMSTFGRLGVRSTLSMDTFLEGPAGQALDEEATAVADDARVEVGLVEVGFVGVCAGAVEPSAMGRGMSDTRLTSG